MANNKKPLFWLVAITLVCLISCQTKEEKGAITLKKDVLKIGVEIGYPPMEYLAEDGKTLIGFDIELATALASRLKLKPEFVDTAWDAIFAGVDTGKYDCIISSITYTDERAEKFNFTRPYIVTSQVLVVRKDSPVKPASLEEVKRLRITFQGETVSDKLFQEWAERTGTNMPAYRYDKITYCFDELALSRVDVILTDRACANSYLARPNNSFEITGQINEKEVFAICLKKGNDALTESLDKALAELAAEKKLMELSQKFLGYDAVSSLWN